ncbi:hemin uptake protein HemP [Vulcaniibacterium gelatinicum]|uniref:hemin uptake protein HemP n=1 Tax=Vulcaniibacterium gelatinicum TaxID=2598725 RepID=UPI0011CC9911|nr:hemin uptake protein HemP [Vulcaniibacterium gelatinicum]
MTPPIRTLVLRRAAGPRASLSLQPAPAPAPGCLDSTVLLRGAREVLIRHGGEVYRLRHTRNDKLILTK